MSSISSEPSSFFASTFSGEDPSLLQIIKQAAVRFDFNGSWKSCTYRYLDVNPHIARLFQEKRFESYGENWTGELEAALKQNPKLIKAAYVTTSDLTTKVGLEILSKIKITLPHSQDAVVSYLGHWISHAFGKNAPPGEYRDKVIDSLREPLTVHKYDLAALTSDDAQADDRKINAERLYGSDDISDSSLMSEKSSSLTLPQILDEEERLLIGVRDDPQKEKIFEYVKEAGIFHFPDISELDQPLREAISHGQVSLHYRVGSFSRIANSAAEMFELFLSLHGMPGPRNVPTALLSRMIDLTFCQSDLTPSAEFLGEVCYLIMSRTQNFVKKETLNLHREIDKVELRGKPLELLKESQNAEQRVKSLKKRLSALWKKLSTFDKRPLLSKEEMEFVQQSLDLRQGEGLHGLEIEYAKRLGQANLQLNYRNELEYVQHLGNLYAKKQEKPSLIHSAGFYNYALRLLEDPKYLTEKASADKEREKEKIFHCLGQLEIQFLRLNEISVGSVREEFERAQHSFKENRRILAEKRRTIDESLAKLGNDPSPEEIIGLQKEITEHMKSFTAQLIDQCIGMLGKPPCDYAVIGLGSMAREEMTHYSDLEFAILIKEGVEQNKKYFRNLTYLLHLKVVNLGETILPALNIPCLKGSSFFDAVIPRGFAFDGAGVQGKGCKTPLGNGTTFELIQTPSNMAQYIGGEWPEKEPHLPMEMLNFTYITGDRELTDFYQERVKEKLDCFYPTKKMITREYLGRHHLTKEDERNFDPTPGDQEKEGQLFKIKQDLYRLPHLSIDRLSLLVKVPSASTFERIESLQKMKIFGEKAANNLRWLICEVLLQRLKVYSHCHAQQELMNPLIKAFGFDEPELVQKQFSIEKDYLPKLNKIYQILIPFYHAMHDFLNNKPKTLQTTVLFDNSYLTLGEIAVRLLQYKQAQDYYLKAKEESTPNRNSRELLMSLGIIANRLQKGKEAFDYFQKAGRISIEENSTPLHSLGIACEIQEKWKEALEYYHRALKIQKDKYGEIHPSIATTLQCIGGVYQHLGKLPEAVSFHQKASAMHGLVSGKESVLFALSLSTLGRSYSEFGRENMALNCYQKAMAIFTKFYGTIHLHIGNCLFEIGNIYEHMGNAEQALTYSKRALAIFEQIFGELHPFVANCLTSIGDCYFGLHNQSDARRYYEKALEIRQKLYGAEVNSDIASNLSCLARIDTIEGDLKMAADRCQQALKLLENPDHNPRAAMASLQSMGDVYTKLEDYPKAFEAYEKLYKICEKTHKGYPHLDTATALYSLGLLHSKQGKEKEACSYLEKALSVCNGVHREPHHKTAAFLNNLGDVYKKFRKIQKAFDAYHQALEIFETLKQRSNIALCLNNIGHLFFIEGKDVFMLKGSMVSLQAGGTLDYTEESQTALPQALKVLESYKQAYPEVVSWLADLYLRLNDHQKALDYYLLIHKKSNLNEVSEFNARLFRTIGACYLILKRKEKALDYAYKSFSIYKHLKNKEGITACLNNITTICAKLGNPPKEISTLPSEFLNDLEAHAKEYPGAVANCLEHLGNCYRLLKREEEALKCLHNAFSLFKKLKNEKKVTSCLKNIAFIFKSLGETPEAISTLEKFLKVLWPYAKKYPEIVFIYLGQLGGLYLNLNKPIIALSYYQEFLKIHKQFNLKEDIEFAHNLNNIGRCYNSLGDNNKSSEYHHKASFIFNRFR